MGYKLQKIYVWSQQVRPSGWQPWANTLAWYPLETDTKDYSWNNRDWTNSNVTFSGGIATFNGNNAVVTVPDASWQRPTANFTISAWARATSWTHTWYNYTIIAKAETNATGFNRFL